MLRASLPVRSACRAHLVKRSGNAVVCAQRQTCKAQPHTQEQLVARHTELFLLINVLAVTGIAHADEALIEPAATGASATEYVIALVPITLYAIFYAYRQFVNPKAGIMDLLFIVGAGVVFANIGSIVFFQTRLF